MAILLDELQPYHAQYYDEDHGGSENETERLLGSLGFLAAFALVSVGAYFTPAQAALGAGAPIYVNGTAYYGITLEEATTIDAALVAADAGDLTLMTPAIGELITASGLAGTTGSFRILSLEAMVALATYSVAHNAHFYGNFGSYLGSFTPFGGGLTAPPGFPGFPGVGYPNPFGTGHFFCVKVGDTTFCHWEE